MSKELRIIITFSVLVLAFIWISLGEAFNSSSAEDSVRVSDNHLEEVFLDELEAEVLKLKIPNKDLQCFGYSKVYINQQKILADSLRKRINTLSKLSMKKNERLDQLLISFDENTAEVEKIIRKGVFHEIPDASMELLRGVIECK